MKKRTAKTLTVLAATVIALGVIYAVAVAISAAKLHRAYAEFEKDGSPMQATDIIPPTIPDSENAALLYQSAVLLLKAQPAELGDVLSDLGGLCDSFLQGTIEPNELARLEEAIHRDVVSQALSILEQGTHRSACRFDRNYNAGFLMDLPVLDLKYMAEILCVKARFEAQADHPAATWELARTQMRFANALLQEPIVISQLVRWRVIRLSCETIQAICRTAPPDRQQTSDLMNVLKTLDDRRPLALAIDGDRLLAGEWLFTLPRYELHRVLRKELFSENDMPDIYYWALFRWITFRPVFLADHAAYLHAMHEASHIMERPYSPDDKRERVGRRHVLAGMLAPSLGRVKEIYLETTAEIRITRAGLTLLQYKQDQGEFPSTLDVLGEKELADPFVDQPLQYHAEPDGFVLYSIGSDQTDNGGTPKQPKSEQKTDFDIVWRFSAGEPAIPPR